MRTKLKNRPLFLFGVVCAALFGIASSNALALTVANGDFSNLTGLTDIGGGWYNGVPTGWTSTINNPAYAVTASGNGNPAPAANLNTLSTLRQNMGTSSVASVVTLTFDIGNFSGGTAVVSITDGASVTYGSGNFTAGNGQTLVATTSAGGPIYVEFSGSASVWVDNVSVSSVPSEIPPLALTNGNFADVSSNTVTGNGWYGGVPAGWTSAAPASDYTVIESGGIYYANLNTLSQTNGATFTPLRQSLGTVGTISDVTISFKAASLTPNAAFRVASGIYSADDTELARLVTPASINGSATLTYSAQGVPAGTQLYVGFLALGGTSPGITDVTVSITAAAKSISIQPGSTLVIDPATPVSTDVNLVFAAGSKVKVAAASAPTASSVNLLSTTGSMSGAPVLDPALGEYTLTHTGNRLRLLQGLEVLNGNFQDLTGLTLQPGGSGWYQGVPAGWSGTSGSYNVIDWSSGNLGANVETLGPVGGVYLQQMAGRVDANGKVRLTFGILGLSGTYGMGAAIYEATPGGGLADWTSLASRTYDETNGSAQTLETTEDIAAGTPIVIAFWSWAGSPGIDNVALSITYANRAPTDISLSGASISENNLVGDVVGTFSATDPDAGDTHDYSLVPGAGDGDGDNASFEIEGSTLKAKLVFDYEAQASYSIRVRSTDAGGLTFEKTFTVTVTDVSEQTPQQAYLESFGLSGDDLLGTADPDGDGMDNDAEFAFGTNPVSGASRAVTLTSGTGEIILTYLQRKTGVTYTVKSLSDLTTPFESGAPVTPYPSANQESLPSDDYERYEAKLTTDSSRGFLQVKAVAP
jgi:hypothetical protein